MSKEGLSGVVTRVQTSIVKHSPEILTGIGIAGMLTTTILAVQATPKALILLEERKVEEGVEKLPPIEVVKATWKCYIPAAVTGVFSIACIVGSSTVHLRRNAALATAYTISDTARREYRDKVREVLGEKKERDIQDAIAKDKVEKDPVSTKEVIITGNGTTLCYDALSKRYFESDIDKLKRAMNEINRMLLNDGFVSLNDFYDEIGLENTKFGFDLGWSFDSCRSTKGLIELYFSSQLTPDQKPCLVLDYSIAPRYDYDK